MSTVKTSISVILTAIVALSLSAFGIVGCSAELAPDISAKTKLHVLSAGYTDAIILESDGMFGIIDSGESADYPDGSDPRYPLRDGIETDSERGVEDLLFTLLDELGVSAEAGNLLFYVGTHPHSDHIGTAAEVIERYRPQYVYTPQYDDSMITDAERLWDNQYVYDRLVNAAHEYGAVLIQTFSREAEEFPEADENGNAVGNPTFTFGDARISICGYNKRLPPQGIEDANEISYQVLMENDRYKTLLLGDIESVGPDEKIIAASIGEVDVLKLGHHGLDGSGSGDFIRTLDPEFVVQTGAEARLADETSQALNDVDAKLYSISKACDAHLLSVDFYYTDRGVTSNLEPTQMGNPVGVFSVVTIVVVAFIIIAFIVFLIFRGRKRRASR